jgi:hypothetical protein
MLGEGHLRRRGAVAGALTMQIAEESIGSLKARPVDLRAPRKSPRRRKDAQDFDPVSANAYGHDVSGLQDDELARTRYATRPLINDRKRSWLRTHGWRRLGRRPMLPTSCSPKPSTQARSGRPRRRRKQMRSKPGLARRPGLAHPDSFEAVGKECRRCARRARSARRSNATAAALPSRRCPGADPRWPG